VRTTLSTPESGAPRRWSGLASALAALALAATAYGADSPAAGPLDLSSHRGHVVIVDFWASWCKPCRQSIPWLNSLRARYGASGLTIIGVNVDAERRDADKFLHDVPIDFEVVFDPQGNIAKQFKVQGMPTSYFIDRSGKLVETHLGFREAKKADIEAGIKALLDAPVH
jgi:cytochrome c biogenesis protein CcmG, thiol:disulfide interchange protein DsbE